MRPESHFDYLEPVYCPLPVTFLRYLNGLDEAPSGMDEAPNGSSLQASIRTQVLRQVRPQETNWDDYEAEYERGEELDLFDDKGDVY